MKRITRKTIKKAKVILPVSESLKSAMLNHGLKGNYQVVPNVVNDSLFVLPEEPVEGLKMLHVSSLDDALREAERVAAAAREGKIKQLGNLQQV